MRAGDRTPNDGVPSGCVNHYTTTRILVLSIRRCLSADISCSPFVVVIPEGLCGDSFNDPGTLDSDTNDSI